MRLITWNVNARTSRQAEQSRFIASRSPDVVALQEVPDVRLDEWRLELTAAGLVTFACSQDDEPRRRGRGLVLAARWDALDLERDNPDRLAGRFPTGTGELEVHNVHIPNGSDNGWGKVEALEHVYSRLTASPAPLRVLCGDLNTPRIEHPDGRVVTWGQTRAGRLRRDRGARWDAAERAVLLGLREHGMVDVFRDLHGYSVAERSWVWNRKGVEGGYRLDHVIASSSLAAVSAEYLHEPRRAGLSDHAALEVVFDLPV